MENTFICDLCGHIFKVNEDTEHEYKCPAILKNGEACNSDNVHYLIGE